MCFSKKKNIKNFLEFDWKAYINKYNDLSFIKTKEEAWYHWMNYGKLENRIIESKSIESKSIESKSINNYSGDEEFTNFDWKSYISNYDDLRIFKTKEEAWKHWIYYGKNEKRIWGNKLIDKKEVDKKEVDKKEVDKNEFDTFDWKSYISNYDDLRKLKTKQEAWNHWIDHGKKENRICKNIFLFDDYKTFDWKVYVQNYSDLSSIHSKEAAWKHFLIYGFNEGRRLDDMNKIVIDEFNRIIQEEENLQNFDFTKNKIYLKKKYTNCGQHFFGWKSTMNYLSNHINLNDSAIFNKKYYFDEWIEKLLVWGNKIQNKQCLDIINKNNLQLISFLHCPPFDNYNSKLMNKDLLLNDIYLLNKHIVGLIHATHIFNSITFLYVLSIHHKNYIVRNYPEFQNKVLSLYHPIDIGNNNNDELFDIYKFINKSKNFYHIGWWLRNFTSFFNFQVPDGYNKLILVKHEFKQAFNGKFKDIDKNIKIIYELNDNEYKKIFNSSCIFCDLEDCVANNLVLECIKYNTPIIIRRLPSIEEYLGSNYPLFFNDDSDLLKFKNAETLNNKIIEANVYLKKMNKKPFMLETFVDKINYDISKLKVNNDKHKLTWLCYLNNEEYDIEKYISMFKYQTNRENNKLIIINTIKSKIDLLEKYKNKNITIINVEQDLNMNEIYNIFVKNATTEYLTFKKCSHLLNEQKYSELCINYLVNNPTFDVVILKKKKLNNTINKKFNNEEDVNNDIEYINNDIDDINDHDINDDDISDLSDSNSDISDQKIDIAITKENKNKECLLSYKQINDFNRKNINILWRKSIHSYVGNFDNDFWSNCYKNNLNIFQVSL